MDDQKMKAIFGQMHFIEQFAESVIDYTSRYNSYLTVSYAPENIIGKPTKYPCYGDYPETYMLRSYGKWWKESEAAQKEYMPQDRDPIESEDYIVVKFEQAVVATRILIYEIFNPGAVVRIWGGRGRGYWSLLWQGEPQTYPKDNKAIPFSPKIKIIQDLIHLIRIEFNQSLSSYHTAIDAVLLAGYKPKTPLQANLIRNGLMEVKLSNHKKKRNQNSEGNKFADKCLFLTLPLEIIVYIFGFLDLRSLCNCALVNRTFRIASNDSLLYRDLCLKRYWNRVCDRTLQHLEPRCKLLRKLDLSWCGGDDKITEDSFVRFLRTCGMHLTHLSLGKCDFVHQKTLNAIAECRELTDLRLRHCWPNHPDNFLVLAELNSLKALDLYSSKIDDQSLLKIIKNNRGLLHLSVDLCEVLRELDLIADTLATYNRKLRTFSCWKTRSLTTAGIKSLSKCNDLRELDVGWCLGLNDPDDCLTHIAQCCQNLTRLILSCWRGISDQHLLPIVRYCYKIRQLDLLGMRGITEDLCERILRNFHDLQLLDVSFCDGVSLRQVEVWRHEYPHIVIQSSCESTNRDFRM